MIDIIFKPVDEAEVIEYAARRLAKQKREAAKQREIMRRAVLLVAEY